MTAPEYLDRPPPGWFVLDVMRTEDSRKRDWCALMIDVHPDEHLLGRRAHHCWVRIAGKHRSRDAAWDVLEDMMATRH